MLDLAVNHVKLSSLIDRTHNHTRFECYYWSEGIDQASEFGKKKKIKKNVVSHIIIAIASACCCYFIVGNDQMMQDYTFSVLKKMIIISVSGARTFISAANFLVVHQFFKVFFTKKKTAVAMDADRRRIAIFLHLFLFSQMKLKRFFVFLFFLLYLFHSIHCSNKCWFKWRVRCDDSANIFFSLFQPNPS